MFILEAIFELIADFIIRVFVEFVYEKIILGFFRLLRKGIKLIGVKIFGLKTKSVK